MSHGHGESRVLGRAFKGWWRDGFWAGAVASWALFGLFQDFLGKEEYIAFLEKHWLPGWLTVPVEVAFLGMIAAQWLLILRVHTRMQKADHEHRVEPRELPRPGRDSRIPPEVT